DGGPALGVPAGIGALRRLESGTRAVRRRRASPSRSRLRRSLLERRDQRGARQTELLARHVARRRRLQARARRPTVPPGRGAALSLSHVLYISPSPSRPAITSPSDRSTRGSAAPSLRDDAARGARVPRADNARTASAHRGS